MLPRSHLVETKHKGGSQGSKLLVYVYFANSQEASSCTQKGHYDHSGCRVSSDGLNVYLMDLCHYVWRVHCLAYYQYLLLVWVWDSNYQKHRS